MSAELDISRENPTEHKLSGRQLSKGLAHDSYHDTSSLKLGDHDALPAGWHQSSDIKSRMLGAAPDVTSFEAAG